MKNILLGLIATLSLPTSAENVFPYFKIFERDFEAALYRAEAENNLLFCAFESEQINFHNLDCFQAVKDAIDLKINYKTIVLKLVLKGIEHTGQDITSLNEEVGIAVNKIDSLQPIDTIARQIIESALSISQKYKM